MNDNLRVAFLTSGGAGSIFVQMNFIFCFWTKMKDEPIDIILYGNKDTDLNEFVMKQCPFVTEYYDYDRRSECFKFDAAVELILYPVIIFENKTISEKSKTLHKLFESWISFVKEKSYRQYSVEYPFCDYFTYQYAVINKKNCVSIYDIQNEIGIKNSFEWNLKIENDVDIVQSFELNPNKYITVQRGATPGIDSSLSPKLWSVENYEELIRILHIIYPDKKIVQLGKENNSIKLKGVDVSLLDRTNWNSLAAVLKNAWLHIDGECGMVHFRKALGAGPSVVLFGSTPIEFYGYKENINISSNICTSWCARLSDLWQERCLKTGDIPVCLSAITPQMVISRIIAWDYLNKIKSGQTIKFDFANDRLYSDPSIYIDGLYKKLYLDNMNIFLYEKKKVKLSGLKALIMEREGFKYVPLSQTPGYLYMCGDKRVYKEHINLLQGKYGDKVHSQERFEMLLNSIDESGFDNNSFILVDDKMNILDGNHRGAWLLKKYGSEYETEIVQIYMLHEDKKWDFFPFEKIKRNATVLIYGASEVGESYVDQLLFTGYATVKGIIDRNPEKWNGKSELREKAICYSSKELNNDIFHDVGYVILATRNDENARQMRLEVKSFINENRIISRCTK